MFDEAYYLARYPDVAAAVAAGHFTSGKHHYDLHGRAEGREPHAPVAAPTPPGKFFLGPNPVTDSSTVFAVRSDHTADASLDQSYHQATFTFTSTGRGVTPGNNVSRSFWGGVTSIFKKGGSGSAHGFTCSVWLEGTTAYAEAGGFQGQVENRSGPGHLLSMFEGIVRDNGHSSNMSGLVVRMQKDSPTSAAPSQGVLVTGEGSGVCDAVLTLPARNATFRNRFRAGVDLSNAQLTSNYAYILPMNAAVGWRDPVAGLVPGLRVDEKQDLWMFISGAPRKVEVGPADSAGPGYRVLRVPN